MHANSIRHGRPRPWEDALLSNGQIVTGPIFDEPMRVETVGRAGDDAWTLGLVGTRSERFRRVNLTAFELEALTIIDSAKTYSADGRLLRLGLQAYALGIAYEFDPFFGLSISRVDPLPHQLEAVYDYFLKAPRVRFLLADDAGAGKTIMAGLLIRELKLRGLAERILVVVPANLAFQWQRELNEKFDEKFIVLKGGHIRDQFGVNQWIEQKRIITSLDLAKRTEILPGLRQVHWDLAIVDEAHHMSAADESHKSMRYRLGELLRDSADHILMQAAITQMEGLLDSGIELREPVGLQTKTVELATQLGQEGAYVAPYLALVETLNCDLWNADERFYQAVSRDHSNVRWIGDARA